MTTTTRLLSLMAACMIFAPAAGAQTPPPSTPPTSQSATPESEASTRPATTTFFGDTGIWFVPTAEVLAKRKWSVSGYRRGTNWIQGYTNVADFAGTFGVGISDRAELFGSFLVDTRIDRDVRPVFVADPNFGGVIDRYPRVNQFWTGDHIGDFYVGAKFNILSEYRRSPAAVALRGMVKLPTADKDVGNGTGKVDGSIDLIVSKEAAKLVEVSGFGGYEFRGSPDDFDGPTGAFRWGAGLAFPSRNFLRVSAELNGDLPNKDTITFTGVQAACVNCGLMPRVSSVENITRATLGLTAQTKKGFFFGAGVSWNVPSQARDTRFSEDGKEILSDYYDMQFRIGYHPGVRVYVPPQPKCEDSTATNFGGALPCVYPRVHDLTVEAACEPCTVEVGKSSTVTATPHSSIGCAVTYRWTVPTGTLAQPAEKSTLWTAPMQEGSVPVTVTVTCPTDNKTASATVNIRVTPAPRPDLPEPIRLEDVFFDFDRYSLRPEATRVLDEAVRALQRDATVRVEIEGHTCNIGTAEYNLALGDRRANAVRNYLIGRGIAADRMRSVSYGEERPKYDNAREETRRLNRRAALVVNLR